ncbi:AMP-dependent synthetase [Bacillus sp. M6-12]|uniref:class I adenylate-forming enzyme family protein n=1 Tax=Bacillus sp. M6-12 TaxID=2054166 RepID=UPI000C768E6F|nr:class I adenylate-forming enzyme family protein [Bacillus sp. M6-12]PLS18615.1 AMP-dependent synthetase [Bacillus sp. M6-12]
MTLVKVPDTFHDLLKESALTFGKKTAFTDGENIISFEDAKRLSLRLAKHFLKIGLKKGDVLAVQLPNSLEYVIAHLAAAQIGLIFNALSPNYRMQELTYMLGHCKAKAFIVPGIFKKLNFEDLAYELKGKMTHLEHIIVAGNPKRPDSIAFSSLLEQDPEGITDEEIKANRPVVDDPAIILFTSGTESNPKAVLHTFRTFVGGNLANGKEYQLSEKDTMLSLTPLCHMFSFPMIMNCLLHGSSHFLCSEYKVEEVTGILQKENVTVLFAAPAHLIDILHHVKDNEAHNTNLRLVMTGGAKIPTQMVKELRHVLNCKVGAQWGMTEISAGTFTRPGDAPAKAWETVGRAAPAGEVIVLDEEHRPLPAGEIGEIAFKGGSLFIEYYGNPAASEAAFTKHGYFLTGDQGFLDEDGYIHFSGRTKDTINRGGLKFHATEIEEALQMHPKIRQAAVVSVPDPRLGERACAFITLRDNESLEFEQIKTFLLDKGFAKYKIPEFLEVRAELPTTPSGKISKGPLRKEATTLSE